MTIRKKLWKERNSRNLKFCKGKTGKKKNSSNCQMINWTNGFFKSASDQLLNNQGLVYHRGLGNVALCWDLYQTQYMYTKLHSHLWVFITVKSKHTCKEGNSNRFTWEPLPGKVTKIIQFLPQMLFFFFCSELGELCGPTQNMWPFSTEMGLGILFDNRRRFISLDHCRHAMSQSKQTPVMFLRLWPVLPWAHLVITRWWYNSVTKQMNRKDVNAKLSQRGQLKGKKGTFLPLPFRPVKTEFPGFTCVISDMLSA